MEEKEQAVIQSTKNDKRYNIFRKYLPKITRQYNNVARANNIFALLPLFRFSIQKLMVYYMQQIFALNYPPIFQRDVIVSGAGCFFGSLMSNYINTGKVDKLEDAFDFAVMYMLADHYLDDPNLSSQSKKNLMQLMYDLLENPKPVKCDDVRVTMLTARLCKILHKHPHIKPYLYDAFYAEIISSKVQSKPHMRSVLLHIAEWKAGSTVVAIHKLLGIDCIADGFKLGACIQYVDDIYDLDTDLHDKVHTIATHDLQANGFLDELLLFTANKIDELPKKYNFYKIFLLELLIHSVQIYPYFTEHCIEKLQAFFIFGHSKKVVDVTYNYMLECIPIKLYHNKLKVNGLDKNHIQRVFNTIRANLHNNDDDIIYFINKLLNC